MNIEKLFLELNLAQIVTIILQVFLAVFIGIKVGKWKPNFKPKELTEDEKKLQELKAQIAEIKGKKVEKEQKLSNAEMLAEIYKKLNKEQPKVDDEEKE